MTGRGPGRGLRADARRNREHILATARALLSEHGPELPMEELARAAGVGVGTLYRRFGGRDALIEAAAQAAFESVMAGVAEAEAATDAWEGFAGFVLAALPDLAVVGCLSRWYPQTWRRLRDGAAETRRRHTIMDVLDRLVRRAQAQQRMRGDVDAEEVATLLALVLRPLPDRADAVEIRRRTTLLLDALRTRP